MATPQQRPLSDMCVLIADDNVDGADSLAALLEIAMQCRVLIAYDGASALHLATEHQPDAMVLDIRMPRLDGIGVARAVRAGSSRPPLLLAATGQADIAEDLPEIDLCFDQAFAKPVDPDQIVDALKLHWLGGPARIAAPPFELSDLFTRTAREVARVVKARGHQLSFDYRGPFVVLAADEAPLHAALFRLPCAVADMMRTGFLIFSSDVQAEPDGSCLVTVNAAGTGGPVSPQRVSEIVARLGLTEQADDEPGTSQAEGSCPNSKGRVEFASRTSEGVLLRLELRCTPLRIDGEVADAQGGEAWIVGENEVGSALLERRLQRLGWQVQHHASCIDASIALGSEPRPPAPRLVIVHQGARNTVQRAILLQRELPVRTRLLFEVAPGATNVEHAEAAGCEVRVAPLSPRELHELTADCSPAGDTRPAPFVAGVVDNRKPVVLVVDDNRVNRVVASGLVEALGYDAVTVGDGLDAIEHCKRSPPSVVLMDVNMPVLGGVDAARRIRELQVLGRIAPFPIVAATADADPEVEAGCLAAGMDGFLAKPLRLAALAHELRRVAPPTGRIAPVVLAGTR
ncbi:MAG: response regulator [Proteobacteria bacterium]|nr:response regulator [Pseudomonadota bacterium]